MNEQEFWALVEDIGWGTKTTDFNTVQKRLLKELTPEQMEAASDHFRTFKMQLYDVAEEDIQHVSDDGLSDLLSHIVGLGKEEFEACLKDFNRIQARACNRLYTESFSYCLPDPEDLSQLEVSHYQKRAANELRIFQRGQTDDPHMEDIQDDLDKVCDALEVMKDGDWQGFLTYEKKVRKALERVKKHFDDLDKYMATIGYVPNRDMSNNIRNEWGVLNLFTDVKNYLQDNG
jgi:hypothetical protein